MCEERGRRKNTGSQGRKELQSERAIEMRQRRILARPTQKNGYKPGDGREKDRGKNENGNTEEKKITIGTRGEQSKEKQG